MNSRYFRYHLIGYLGGKGVYVPDQLATNRSLSIEEDHGVLQAMNEDELVAWNRHQQDLAMTRKLEEERERADRIFARCDLGRYVPRYERELYSRQAAEDWYAEVGKAMAQGSSDVPEVA